MARRGVLRQRKSRERANRSPADVSSHRARVAAGLGGPSDGRVRRAIVVRQASDNDRTITRVPREPTWHPAHAFGWRVPRCSPGRAADDVANAGVGAGWG